MNKDRARAEVARALERFGFEVEEIPESSEKGADLLVTGEERTLVEVKTREDDAEQIAGELEITKGGELAHGSEPYGYKNRASGIIRAGVEQLSAHPPSDADLRVLWLNCFGRFAEVQLHQFKATLYGLTQIVDIDDEAGYRLGFYFHNSDFFRYRKALDGAVVWALNEAQLLVNTLSPKVGVLRSSSFAAAFEGAVYDPEEVAQTGGAFIVDSDVDRSDSDAVLRYLQKKTGREKLMHIEMGHQWVATSIPLDSE